MRIATLALALLLPAAAPPADQELQVSGTMGWGGRAVRGEFAPVLIDLDNRGKKDIELTIAVTWAASFASQPQESPSLESVFGKVGPAHYVSVALPSKSRKRLSLSLLTPDSNQISVWAFALDKGGRTVARGEMLARLVDLNKRVVAVVGQTRPEGLEDAGVELANILPDELPEEWQGYGALDALVWIDGRATEIRSTAQVDALKQWISSGGRFFVARANAINLSGTPIAELLPVKLGATKELESLGGGRFPSGSAVVLESTLRKGVILAESGGVPIIVESMRDAGKVTFAAFNPANPPFQGWTGATAFWKWFLALPPPPKPTQGYEERPPRAIGSKLLAQQAGRFPDIAAPEIGGLFMLIILYLVVVGPIDYLLLRWLRKLEYTWFTFPAYVVIFTMFILLVGGAFIQRAAHQREIAVVDHYPETGFARRHALSAVLAPADVIYKVDDAQPFSSNFIQNNFVSDSGGKTSDVRMLRTPARVGENWLINRNFTGLAVADRCSTETSPLTYAIGVRNRNEVRLTVKNTTGEAFEGATLVTANGCYRIGLLPAGDSTPAGTRIADTPAEFAKSEGQVDAPQQNEYYNNRYAQGITERELNPAIRKALVGVCFPSREEHTADAISGLARGLDTRAWLKSGGSILLAWPQKADAVVHFEPKPGRFTSVTLYRFFQGPQP